MPSYRSATHADLPTLFAVENTAGFSRWTAAQLQDSVDRHDCYIVEKNACTAGFAIFSKVFDEAELLNLVIAPEQQGNGLASGLLQYGLTMLLQQNIRQCFLEVGVTNVAAIHLYRKHGFSEIAVRKNYYQHANVAEDALIMQLWLEEMPCKN